MVTNFECGQPSSPSVYLPGFYIECGTTIEYISLSPMVLHRVWGNHRLYQFYLPGVFGYCQRESLMAWAMQSNARSVGVHGSVIHGCNVGES